MTITMEPSLRCARSFIFFVFRLVCLDKQQLQQLHVLLLQLLLLYLSLGVGVTQPCASWDLVVDPAPFACSGWVAGQQQEQGRPFGCGHHSQHTLSVAVPEACAPRTPRVRSLHAGLPSLHKRGGHLHTTATSISPYHQNLHTAR